MELYSGEDLYLKDPVVDFSEAMLRFSTNKFPFWLRDVKEELWKVLTSTWDYPLCLEALVMERRHGMADTIQTLREISRFRRVRFGECMQREASSSDIETISRNNLTLFSGYFMRPIHRKG